MNASGTDTRDTSLDPFFVQLAERYANAESYAAGATLFAEGDPGETMLLILSGLVQITKHGPGEEEPVVIATRGPGEFLGEMALVEDCPRFATAQAAEDSMVLVFSHDNFHRIISEAPELATHVLKSLSAKLRQSDSTRIAELEENNRRLTESNDELVRLNTFLDLVVDQSPSAVLLASEDGAVIRSNFAAARMFGLGHDEGVTLRFDDLLADCSLDDLQVGLLDIWSGKVTAKRGDARFPAYLSVSTIRGDNDAPVYLIMCQDISELQAFDDTISEFEKHAKAHNTAIELAHDMKNYLGVLLGSSELIVSRLTPEQRDKSARSLEAIKRTSDDMMQYIETAMSGPIDGQGWEPVNLRAMAETVIRFCQPQAIFRDIVLDCKTSSDFPASVPIREGEIQGVLVNLLINAAESLASSDNPAGKRIILELGLNEAGDRATVGVTDTGPGIDQQHRDRLFKEQFTTKSDGHGIGLVAIDRIVRSHGGSISVASDPGARTTFTIELPVNRGV